MSSNESRRSRLASSLLALAAICALSAALAAPAGAFSASGNAVFVTASHDKGRTLSGQGVQLLAGNGGSAQGSNLTLPIAEVNSVGSQPTATSAASLTFKKGKAAVVFNDIRFNLSAGTIAGKLAGTETSIFRVEGSPQVNSGSGAISLSGGKLRLIGTTAQNLRDELGLERALNSKGVGTVWLAANAKPTQVKRAVTSGALDWDFLASWREYIYKELGPGSVGSIVTEGGATTVGEPGKAGSYFVFPTSGGVIEEGLFGAPTLLSAKTAGSVKFAKPGHCIMEIKFSNLEAKIDGANSSLVGDLNYDVDKPVGKTCEDQPPVSVPGTTIATLNASGVAPVYSTRRQDGHLGQRPGDPERNRGTAVRTAVQSRPGTGPGDDLGGGWLIRTATIRLYAIAAGALALAAIALPAQSQAAVSGATKLKLDGPAATALRDPGRPHRPDRARQRRRPARSRCRSPPASPAPAPRCCASAAASPSKPPTARRRG